MLRHVLSPDPVSICVLVLGGALAGLVDLLCGPRLRSRDWMPPAAFSTVAVAAGLIAYLFDLLTESTSFALFLLGSLCGFPFLLRLGWVRGVYRALSRLSGSRQFQSLGLLAVSAFLALAWVAQPDIQDLLSAHSQNKPHSGQLILPLQLLPICAWTDRDRVIRLYRTDRRYYPSAKEVSQLENRIVGSPGMSFRLIRESAPDGRANCHGWVFTEGQYWIHPDDVPLILEDNGYLPVSDPVAGDLAVSRNAEGRCIHSGMVRSGSPGPLLIESKWGYLGSYIHGPSDHPFGSFTWYHSSRSGHLLRGLNHAGPVAKTN